MSYRTAACLLIGLGVFATHFTAAADEGWGHLKGQIKVTGELPEIPYEVIDKDQATCGKKGPMLDDNLLVSEDGFLRDVVVMMYRREDSQELKIHPSYQDAASEAAVLDNVACRFVPHVVLLRIGQPLKLKNSDDVGHNCHITMFNNEENINLPAGGSVEIKFKNPETIPGVVTCDIHKWMDAVIMVRDEPYFAVTDENGEFLIENIPEGTWKFQFWHKKGGYLRDLEIANYKIGRRGEIEINIENESTLDLGEMTIKADALDK